MLADPSRCLIDKYICKSKVFTATEKDQTVGVIVLYPLSKRAVEIKNLAVISEFRRKGIGLSLIEKAIEISILCKYKSIYIGTANSSIGQFYWYQKLGFDLVKIRRNFFSDHYPEPIYENGLQAKHLLVLKKQL